MSEFCLLRLQSQSYNICICLMQNLQIDAWDLHSMVSQGLNIRLLFLLKTLTVVSTLGLNMFLFPTRRVFFYLPISVFKQKNVCDVIKVSVRENIYYNWYFYSCRQEVWLSNRFRWLSIEVCSGSVCSVYKNRGSEKGLPSPFYRLGAALVMDFKKRSL